ncbi:Coiled-coil domain-containing 191 [Apodemus speciosus]|uniref:Coiled-coil domain-containing 191 n=1 Tax=Apodemus speciosus TaxID=105296 RepID=A0ABQ0FM20_APOSI
MELSRWKRLSRKLNLKSSFEPDNVGHWIKRVEKTSEFAISNTYSTRNADLPGRFWQQAVDVATCEQTEYHDDVYEEAQELVDEWLDNKLKEELASDGEGEGTVLNPPVPDAHGHLKYDKFDELCGYLEEEEESATVQKFIEHLLQKEVVASEMVEELGMEENQGKRQQKDPRLTMEMRHKQVKENRLRREKQLESQRMESAVKKAAFLEAQCLVQEEKKRKALLAKKEKEEIQREMEKKRQEEISQRKPERKMMGSAHIHLDEEKVAKERKRKLREILIRTFKENRQAVCVGHLQRRHVYQQQLIEKQKKKLEEQQKTIQKLKENQRSSVPSPMNVKIVGPVPESPLSVSKKDPEAADSAPSLAQRTMEERAIQRAERRQILAERKKKQEEDKLAQLKAQEEERQKKEEEEKEAQLERKREERRLRKMKELEKQKRIKRNQELEAVAKGHYEKFLLRKKGLEPWKRLRMQSKQNVERKCLLSWFQYSQESLAMKTAKADQFYSQILYRRVIGSWLQYVSDVEKEVRKLCAYLLQKKVFKAWLTTVRELKMDSQRMLKIATEHCDRKILRVTLEVWKAFVKLTKEERVKEERRDQLRRKVAEILPDFQMLAPS